MDFFFKGGQVVLVSASTPHFTRNRQASLTRMALLLSLPAEVLSEIFNYLPRSSFSSFCQTSKRAQAVAEPPLYSQIEWTFSHGGEQNESNRAHQIHPFFRTISHHPELAEQVKTAVLLSGTEPSAWATRLPLCPTPTDSDPEWLKFFDTKVQPLLEDTESAQLHRNEVQNGNPGALVGTLLRALPNLASLTLDYPLLQQSHLPLRTLPRLTNLAILNTIDSRLINIFPTEYPPLASLFSSPLPTLQHLTTPFQALQPTLLLNPSLPSLLTLNLTSHFTHPSALSHLLTCTPALAELSYFHIEDMDTLVADANGFHIEDNTAMWESFSAAVQSVASTIETLRISVDLAATTENTGYISDADWVFGISKRRGGLGTLRGCDALKGVEVPMYLLFNTWGGIGGGRLGEVLPVGLKVLTLRDDYVFDEDLEGCAPGVVIPALEEFLRECEELEEVRLMLRLRGFGQGGRDGPGITGVYSFLVGGNLRALEKMGRKAGVKVVVYMRESSELSAERGCVDLLNELVLFDPNDPGSSDDGGSVVKGAAAYLKRKVHKRARCFISNWEE
ncbi:hypothetical protein QBC34DRAFT_385986 [Podospora aff. communis PSN243]|uniref:F-box domain-containing protein n=1 Tax=Podospora aff. communis PSN243 TaxID=3040156 RepID=A0AAV9G8R1_9PEZI|nr:hypothetical protein QBC34DRAFT_385986 [Podospora aff. communis PSN243]